MTKSTLLAACGAFILSAALAVPAAAQAPAQPQHTGIGSPVAILDLPYLFRNHARFKQMDEVLKTEIQTAEQQFLAEQKALKEKAARLAEFRPGSDEYKREEESLAKADADIALRVNIMRKNVAEKKAKNYFDVYQEVMSYVTWQATENNILLVLNFNGDPIDGSNPQSVIQGLNSTVLYKHRGVDITPVILDLANRGVQIPAQYLPNVNAQHGVPTQR